MTIFKETFAKILGGLDFLSINIFSSLKYWLIPLVKLWNVTFYIFFPIFTGIEKFLKLLMYFFGLK